VLATGIGLVIEFNKNVLLGEWELPADTPILGRVPRIVPRQPDTGVTIDHGGSARRAALAAK
jgi:hypothetical protein